MVSLIHPLLGGHVSCATLLVFFCVMYLFIQYYFTFISFHVVLSLSSSPTSTK